MKGGQFGGWGLDGAAAAGLSPRFEEADGLAFGILREVLEQIDEHGMNIRVMGFKMVQLPVSGMWSWRLVPYSVSAPSLKKLNSTSGGPSVRRRLRRRLPQADNTTTSSPLSALEVCADRAQL